ncbi:MAG: hypothetical protein N4A63_08295 [Vallitalea sp.]|nr:hypothetical protein [Vallitalea sp.]
MILESILSAISKMLNWIVGKIPRVDLSDVDFAGSLTYLVDLGKKLNFIFPIKESLIFFGILISIKFALILFWASMRVINLIRGAG